MCFHEILQPVGPQRVTSGTALLYYLPRSQLSVRLPLHYGLLLHVFKCTYAECKFVCLSWFPAYTGTPLRGCHKGC